MRTSNPAFSNKNAFGVADWNELGAVGAPPEAAGGQRRMTVQGTVNASFILITTTIAAAMAAWYVVQNSIASPVVVGLGGLGVGFVCALIMWFSPRSSVALAWPYAIGQGAFLAVLSMFVEHRLAAKIGAAAASGIVFQAIMLTFGIFFSLLIAYKFRIVRVGAGMRAGIIAATGGLCLLYLVNFAMTMFNLGSIGFIHSSGPWGIGFSIVVVILASLNLVLDFQNIEEAAEHNAPKYMEWYCSFALLATLVWLYVEVLRLMAKLADRK